jgi:hypothetical protein
MGNIELGSGSMANRRGYSLTVGIHPPSLHLVYPPETTRACTPCQVRRLAAFGGWMKGTLT